MKAELRPHQRAGDVMKALQLQVDRTVLAAIAMATLFASFVAGSTGAARMARVFLEGAWLYLGNTRG